MAAEPPSIMSNNASLKEFSPGVASPVIDARADPASLDITSLLFPDFFE